MRAIYRTLLRFVKVMQRSLLSTLPETLLGQTPSLNNKVYLVPYFTTHGAYTYTSHQKDETVIIECFAQGHSANI